MKDEITSQKNNYRIFSNTSRPQIQAAGKMENS